MLTFMPGETRTSLTFSAAHDDVDDDEESVKLGIGSVPAGVTRGNDGEATVTIVDDPDDVPLVSVNFDDDEVSVSFERAAYSVAEGGDAVTVTVRLSAAAERTFTIDLVKTDQDSATGDDYSGLPDRLMFAPGDTEQSFSFSALPDADSDAGESALLEFGTLPPGVIAGEPA